MTLERPKSGEKRGFGERLFARVRASLEAARQDGVVDGLAVLFLGKVQGVLGGDAFEERGKPRRELPTLPTGSSPENFDE